MTWVVDDLPDDSLVGVLRFMKPLGAVRLLQVSRRWALRLRRRNDLWQMLCLERAAWRAQLPKRPRKPWVDIFLTMLRKEVEQRNGKSDEVMKKANVIIKKGDNLASLQKLVEAAEEAFDFSVNYQSPIIMERNPLLNLAILHPLPKKAERTKIIEWLVLKKKAHVNLADKGGFTPLLDAAFTGHKATVLLLLNHGADPAMKGHSHFSGGIKTTERTAEEWATINKHEEVASLIKTWTWRQKCVLAGRRPPQQPRPRPLPPPPPPPPPHQPSSLGFASSSSLGSASLFSFSSSSSSSSSSSASSSASSSTSSASTAAAVAATSAASASPSSASESALFFAPATSALMSTTSPSKSAPPSMGMGVNTTSARSRAESAVTTTDVTPEEAMDVPCDC
jgi:hypothetical protein